MRYSSIVKVVGYIVPIAVSLLWSLTNVAGQTLESRLGEPVAAFDSDGVTTEEQLLDFARHFKLPMGLELIGGDGGRAAPIQAKGGTALNVLKMIINQRSGYDFDIADGVLNVYPTKLVGDPRNFLNLRLTGFQIENQNLIGAKYYLKLSIQQRLHPSTNFGGGYGGVKLNSDLYDVKINFSGQNLTVRQILNRLILLQGSAGWIVRLEPRELMPGQPFYAQALSATTTDVAPDFFWEFVSISRAQLTK